MTSTSLESALEMTVTTVELFIIDHSDRSDHNDMKTRPNKHEQESIPVTAEERLFSFL